jgi:predicted dehydrogenase
MTRVAIVGYGFMGRTHYGAWKKCRGAKVVAICDSNLAQLNTKVVGNIKGAADNSKLPRTIKIYADYDEMLAAGGFDVVDLTVPTPLHAPMSIKALNAHFHVLCEKPMALNLADADAMLAASVRAGRFLLIAHCVRFDPAYSYLYTLIQSKKYGRLIAADFSRFMSNPRWAAQGASWVQEESKSGGLYLDAHIHDVDYILSIFGVPQRMRSRAHFSKRGTPDHLISEYTYTDGKLITSDCSFAAATSFLFQATARVFFERATVILDSKSKTPLTVYPMEGKSFSPKLSANTAYDEEIRYFNSLVVKHPTLTHRADMRDLPFMTAADARQALALAIKERAIAANR